MSGTTRGNTRPKQNLSVIATKPAPCDDGCKWAKVCATQLMACRTFLEFTRYNWGGSSIDLDLPRFPSRHLYDTVFCGDEDEEIRGGYKKKGGVPGALAQEQENPQGDKIPDIGKCKW